MCEMIWRRFELTTQNEQEKKELERILDEKNLSRKEIAGILLGLHVEPGFSRKAFGI